MSAPDGRGALVRSIREALLELAAEGVEYVGPLPARAGARSRQPSAPASTGVPVEPTRRPAPAASPLPPGFKPRVAPLLPVAALSRSAEQKLALLEVARSELGECTRCRLHEARRQIVWGEGNPDASVVFVGEGPGDEEDRSGRPFVGRSGELLTRMIQAVGWQREDVYICNVVKCRPPGNRNPELDEVATCRPFLERQLLAIQPRVVVTLGKPAISTLLGRDIAITRMRGIWQEWNGLPVMPTFHPAFLLRSYTQQNRQAVWDDLRAVRARVDEAQTS